MRQIGKYPLDQLYVFGAISLSSILRAYLYRNYSSMLFPLNKKIFQKSVIRSNGFSLMSVDLSQRYWTIIKIDFDDNLFYIYAHLTPTSAHLCTRVSNVRRFFKCVNRKRLVNTSQQNPLINRKLRQIVKDFYT